MLVDGKKLNGE